jgi:hypothetical protein
MEEPGDRLSLLGRPLPPVFEVHTVAVAPGRERAYDDADWRDALVVVERGEIELDCRGGASRCYARGEVLWLSGLPVRALRNRGGEHALLVAVRRRAPPGAGPSTPRENATSRT